MKNKKLLIAVVATLALLALGGGGAWYYYRGSHAAADAEPEKPPVDKRVYKYVSLDKIIVMLRPNEGEETLRRGAHYLAVDLVFKTPQEQEKTIKEHLPMLRSVAVKALATYTRDAAIALTIDQFSAAISRAYSESYAREQQEKPFTDVMIGKLIIE